MKINSKEERQKYLEENIGDDIGSYALVTYDNHIESIWIANMGNSFSDDGKNWYLESPNQLYTSEIDDKQTRSYYNDCGFIIRENKAYEINSWQTAPFLPDVIDDLTLISEKECLNWLIEQDEIYF